MTKVTQAHLDARREEILAAGVKIFARKGMQSATMAEIAEEAGISAGAIYRYFANKEDLAAFCMGQSGEQVTSAWRQLKEQSGDPRTVFEAMARESFEEINAPDAANESYLMFESQLAAARAGDSRLLTESRRSHQLIVDGLAEAIAKMQEADQFPPSLNAQQLAAALLSFYYGARLTKLVNGDDADTDAQLEQVWRLMSLASAASAPAPVSAY